MSYAFNHTVTMSVQFDCTNINDSSFNVKPNGDSKCLVIKTLIIERIYPLQQYIKTPQKYGSLVRKLNKYLPEFSASVHNRMDFYSFIKNKGMLMRW